MSFARALVRKLCRRVDAMTHLQGFNCGDRFPDDKETYVASEIDCSDCRTELLLGTLVMGAREVLLRTAAHIERHGLRRDGQRGIGNGPCSVVGAMDAVSGHCSDAARKALLHFIGKPVSENRAVNGLIIDTWAVAPGRTDAEVIAVVMAAAEAAL